MTRLNIALLVLMVSVGGCGRGGEGLVAVRGTVKFTDGQPVTGEYATIVFCPDRTAANVPAKSASGTIQPDGTFSLMTHEPDDGALPGDYKVVLQVWSIYRERKPGVPQKYSEETSTPLQASVGSGKSVFDFSVEK